jgi:hypothetical protein
MNTRNLALAVLLLAVAPVSPCLARADITYATLHAGEPAIPDGMGRIYVYRENAFMGGAVEPAIKIDGVDTQGYSMPGEYFYIDRPAGSITLSTSTEKNESTQVEIVAGKAVYVKTEVSMGFFVGHVTPSVVDEATAAQTIAGCELEKFELSVARPATTAPAPAAAPATAPATDPKN